MPFKVLIHPLARDADIDHPSTTLQRKQLIQEKVFLKRIYEEWYTRIAKQIPAGPGRVLEVGSGAGFLSRHVPDLITSDVFPVTGLALALDSRQLPFASGSLRAITMTDVFHHIPEPALFLHEAARCVRPGGAVVMIEPWHSPWSRWVYQNLHHEPYRPETEEWSFPAAGPLSGANGALPWIVFERDRGRFSAEHPQWRLAQIERFMPFRYLLSGGVTYRSLTPAWTFSVWKHLERILPMRYLAMFASIKLERTEHA